MNKDMELTEACGKPKLGTFMMQDRTSNGRSSVSVTSISCVEGIIQHWYFLTPSQVLSYLQSQPESSSYRSFAPVQCKEKTRPTFHQTTVK